MQFASFSFLYFFFPISLAVYLAVPKHWKPMTMLIISAIFILSGGIFSAGVLLLLTAGTFGAGLLLDSRRGFFPVWLCFFCSAKYWLPGGCAPGKMPCGTQLAKAFPFSVVLSASDYGAGGAIQHSRKNTLRPFVFDLPDRCWILPRVVGTCKKIDSGKLAGTDF